MCVGQARLASYTHALREVQNVLGYCVHRRGSGLGPKDRMRPHGTYREFVPEASHTIIVSSSIPFLDIKNEV